jgi:hypothetical protein
VNLWLSRIALASIALAACGFAIVFYQQESATKYVMMEVPTVLVVIEPPAPPTQTPTRTPRPTTIPTITPTPWPQYDPASPQAGVLVVPRWTETPVIPVTTEPEVLLPCITVTPDKFFDTFCEVAE